METKRCSKCGEVKALGAFAVRRGQCLVCRAEWARGHRVKNAEAIAAKKREWETRNAEAIAAKKREYWARNAAAFSAKRRELWRVGDNDAALERSRKYHAENAEAIAAKKREYWEKNKAAYVARGQRYRDRAKDALTDSHVRSRLYATTGLLAHQIPDELVRMKRAMLATKRKVRAINNHVKEQNRE